MLDLLGNCFIPRLCQIPQQIGTGLAFSLWGYVGPLTFQSGESIVRLMKIRRFFFFLGVGLLFLETLSCGGKTEREPRSKTNFPPVVLSVAVLPEKAFKGTELSAAVQAKDPDGDPVTYRYQWIRNDEEMAGETGPTLKGERFRKGDSIQVRVTPSDGKEEGRALVSSPVKILNSPPVVQEVLIEPGRPTSSDSLTARPRGSDPDGDFIYYSFQWEKNGRVMDQERNAVLEAGKFVKGDSIAVTVTPDDREVQGTPKKSQAVVISGSPPIITSSPSSTVEKGMYKYQVKVRQVDHGRLAFVLKSGPAGMTIDKDTGFIQWGVEKEARGTYPVEIEVSDDEGAKSTQKYELTVDFK